MSIYRKFAGDAKNDVHVNTLSPNIRKPDAAETARAENERSKRRKAAPMDAPLPRTFTWAAKLPRDVQPIELMKAFPRIANVIAAEWNNPDAMYEYFDDLLHDRRGNRKGFPLDVMTELLALRAHYAGLHPHFMSSWQDINKR